MTLLPDPCVIELNGEPTLLLHGDILCTDDVDYLAFRQQVRQLKWQQEFLAQPLAQRQAFASKARGESKAHQQGRAMEIGDANPDAVSAMLQRYGIARMIHGHTHRPAVHEIASEDDVARQRIVLGDWYEQGSVLRVGGDAAYSLDGLS
jgi:UDP-2,3-diacylglucosamine hydrolase